MVTRVIRRGKQHFYCDSCKNDTKALRFPIVCSGPLIKQDQALKGEPRWRFREAGKEARARFTSGPADAFAGRHNGSTPQFDEELRRRLVVEAIAKLIGWRGDFRAGASVLGDDRACCLRSPNPETETGPDRDATARGVLVVKLICDPSLNAYRAEIVAHERTSRDGLLLSTVHDRARERGAGNAAAGDIGCCLID